MNAHPESYHHNRLIHRIIEESLNCAIKEYARGVLIDIGCGIKPYRRLTEGLVTMHIGIDHPNTAHENKNIDVFASAYHTGLANHSADTILSTFVLEHLERPEDALMEMYRILKPGGNVILMAPLFWHLHEEPRDFYRFTQHGLDYLFTLSGFRVLEIKPLSGFMVTFIQELCYWIEPGGKGPFIHPLRMLQDVLQWFAYQFHRSGKDRSTEFTWAYMVIATK